MKPKPLAPMVIKPSSRATVVVFDQTKYGISKLKGPDGKGFKRKAAKTEDMDDAAADTPVARPGSKDPDEYAPVWRAPL